jgi:hypothetical protein
MRTQLVDDWIRYHAESRKPSDPLFAVCEQVDDLVERDPEAGWSLILELIAAAGDDRVLAAIAAGPLEDILRRSLEQFIERTEVEARRDPRFRRCLTGVWGLPASAQERLAKYLSTVKTPL